MKVLQINTTANTTSTGRITEEIGRKLISEGHESVIGYNLAGPTGSSSSLLKIGNRLDTYIHGVKTRLLDRHGFGSRRVTEDFIGEVEKVDPDIIGLHNLHGYYLNIEALFNYLKEVQKPVVWTFHDCWPFTGHCTYFDRVNCEKWKAECHHCPMKTYYPASYGLDRSNKNFNDKRDLFTGLNDLTIVTPSHWLKGLVQKSFLKEYPVNVIHNGIDLEVFISGTEYLPESLKRLNKKIVLGVASTWDDRKGLGEFEKLAKILDKTHQIVLVGLSSEQIQELPDTIIGIERTENVQQLASLYSAAKVFANPTLSDNFPTTNIEAIACGTPVVTYKTGGSPEAIDEETGLVVEQRDIEGLKNAIEKVSGKGQDSYQRKCRQRALNHFNKEDRFRDYLDLYERMVGSGLNKGF